MTMGGARMVAGVIIAFLIMVVNAEAVAQKTGGNMVVTMCGVATYKDACLKSLQAVANANGITPQLLVERGVKLALEEATKASANPALKSCKDLLDQAKDRLQDAAIQVVNATSFKDPAELFNLRIELGDVNSFATTCVDEAPPRLQKLFKDGTASAMELSVDMLDVVTIFNEQLSQRLLLPVVNRRLLASA